MKTSDRGIALIERFERFRANPYQDVGGIPTIGFGSCCMPDGSSVTMRTPQIMIQRADQMLRNDVAKIETHIKAHVTVSLSQPQFDALVSFIYNVGSGNFDSSTLLKKLNDADYIGASTEFLRWDKVDGKNCDGLLNRRKAERQLFLSG